MKLNLKTLVFRALVLTSTLVFTSCEGALDDIFGEWSRPTPGSSTGGDSTPEVVTSISIDATLTLVAGKTSQLTATVDPAGAAVTWISDKEEIATVDANGLVTAVAAGAAIITAKAGDKSATCKVTVLPKGTLAGVFSVSATKQVRFSQGNLQATYDGTKWTWAFAENQWDCIGNAAANTSITGNGTISGTGTVDLFCWVGESSTTLTSDPAKYGISISTTNAHYGTEPAESLKSDWGTNMGAGWRTLTGGDSGEWYYLFNTRTVNGGTGSGKSYTLGQSVNGKLGIVIYPDDYTGGAYTTGSDWSEFEAAGCVFLPAAGIRQGGSVVGFVDNYGFYWSSSSPNASPVTSAHCESFGGSGLDVLGPSKVSIRYNALSVRLVYDVK